MTNKCTASALRDTLPWLGCLEKGEEREREGERARQERMVKEERQARPDDGGGG